MLRILLDDPLHAGGSDQLIVGTSANDGTGDGARVAFQKLKLWAADVNSMTLDLFSATPGAFPLISLTELQTQYTAANTATNALAATTNAGLQQFTGTAWVSPGAFSLGQDGIPVLIPPSGYIGANGAYVIGQSPGTTVTFGATSGTGVSMTFGTGTLLGTSGDNGRILTILDSGTYKYATITAFSSSTVATVTITGTLSSTTPAAANIWLSGAPTGTSGYSTPLTQTYANGYAYVATNKLYCTLIQDSGTATGGSTTTIVDSTSTWATNQWAGNVVVNTTTGQSAVVTSNTATTLTFAAMATANASTNTYQIGNGNISGLYFFQSLSPTVLQLYDYVGILGQLQVPTSPTAITSPAMGAYTQLTNASVQLGACNLPPGVMGPNGALEINWVWSSSNSASSATKRCTCSFGGTSIGTSDFVSATIARSDLHFIRNRGATNAQVTLSSTTGDPGTGVSINNLAIDTNLPQPILLGGQLDTGSANEWLALESWSVTCKPGGIRDALPAQIYAPASAIIVPQGAKDLGLVAANNKYFDVPNSSNISLNSTVTAKYYPGLDYQYVSNVAPWNLLGSWASPVAGQGSVPYASMQTVNGLTSLQLVNFGLLYSGTATGGSTTTLVDSGQSWTTNALKGSQLQNVINGVTTTIVSNTATTLTVGSGTANASGQAYLIFSATPGLATGVGNTQAGTLGTLNFANPTYVEAAIRLSSNHQDHWEAWWMLPRQKSNTSAPGLGNWPYVEIDIHEGGYAADANNPAYTMHASIINWPAGSNGSSTVVNNLSPGHFGHNLDRTRQQIYGMQWNPSTKILQPYINNTKLPYFVDTTSYFSNIQNALYYMIFGPQSHGRNIPYAMWVDYISAWGG